MMLEYILCIFEFSIVLFGHNLLKCYLGRKYLGEASIYMNMILHYLFHILIYHPTSSFLITE